MASALHTLLACLLGGIAFLAKPCQSLGLDGERYFVASFPSQAKIVYMRDGHQVLRDLIVGGHESLGAIAIDATNARLYVADVAVQTIFWYQLVALPDGRLTTDGRKNTAIVTIEAQSLECDGGGNLYVGGAAILAVTPSLPPPPVSIMKFTWYQLLTGATNIVETTGIWNTENSGDPPKLWKPSSIETDGFTLFWGNGVQGGSHGTIVEGRADGGGALKVHVDQGESVGSVVMTPEFLFYSTESGIFGTPRYKKEQGCGKPASPKKKPLNAVKLGLKGGSEPNSPCRIISSSIHSTKGMVWDGDGTVYALDPNSGIYSFPSGNIEEHRLTKMIEMEGLFDMDMLQVSFSTMKAAPSVIYVMITVAAVFLQK